LWFTRRGCGVRGGCGECPNDEICKRWELRTSGHANGAGAGARRPQGSLALPAHVRAILEMGHVVMYCGVILRVRLSTRVGHLSNYFAKLNLVCSCTFPGAVRPGRTPGSSAARTRGALPLPLFPRPSVLRRAQRQSTCHLFAASCSPLRCFARRCAREGAVRWSRARTLSGRSSPCPSPRRRPCTRLDACMDSPAYTGELCAPRVRQEQARDREGRSRIRCRRRSGFRTSSLSISPGGASVVRQASLGGTRRYSSRSSVSWQSWRRRWGTAVRAQAPVRRHSVRVRRRPGNFGSEVSSGATCGRRRRSRLHSRAAIHVCERRMVRRRAILERALESRGCGLPDAQRRSALRSRLASCRDGQQASLSARIVCPPRLRVRRVPR
jgi:hypothetical protein